MKKFTLSLLTFCIAMAFAAAACAAPLTNAQVRPLIQKLVREGHKIEDRWSYEALFKKGVVPALYDPSDVKYYPVDLKSFPYKTAAALVADTRRIFSRQALDDMGVFKLPPRYKDVGGVPCALYFGDDGDPREMKWITKSAVIVSQTPDRLTARVKWVALRTGSISTGSLALAKENGLWKLDQSSYDSGRALVK